MEPSWLCLSSEGDCTVLYTDSEQRSGDCNLPPQLHCPVRKGKGYTKSPIFWSGFEQQAGNPDLFPFFGGEGIRTIGMHLCFNAC